MWSISDTLPFSDKDAHSECSLDAEQYADSRRVLSEKLSPIEKKRNLSVFLFSYRGRTAHNEISAGFHYGFSALEDRKDEASGVWGVTVGHRLDCKSLYKVCITEHSELLQLWTNSITVLLQAECTVLVFRERQTQEVRGGGWRRWETKGGKRHLKLFILPNNPIGGCKTQQSPRLISTFSLLFLYLSWVQPLVSMASLIPHFTAFPPSSPHQFVCAYPHVISKRSWAQLPSSIWNNGTVMWHQSQSTASSGVCDDEALWKEDHFNLSFACLHFHFQSRTFIPDPFCPSLGDLCKLNISC